MTSTNDDSNTTTAEAGQQGPKGAKRKTKSKAKPKAKKATKPGKAKVAKPKTRDDSKQARFIEALQSAQGMSITEAGAEFGWQPHTVRGAVAGAVKKKMGFEVTAERDEKRGTVYRIK